MRILLLVAYLAVVFAGLWLKYLNLSYLRTHGKIVPPEFSGVVDPATLGKIADYTFDTSRLGTVESIVRDIVLLVFLFGGYIGTYDRWIASLAGSFLGRGILFFLIILAAQTLLDIPFSLYRNFSIENKYGFNTMTLRTWITDLLKSLAVSLAVGGVMILSALSIVQSSPGWWWLWVWLFLLLFGIFMMYVSPYVIEPLFFKFEPLKIEGLEERIRTLLSRAGLTVSKVFQVDASRRSRHSNAYFTGIGRVKRIVLFDTLVGQMDQDEVLAVLAHEAGHWKKRHVLKRIVVAEATALISLFATFHALSWGGLPQLIGLDQASFYARLVIVGFAGSIVMFPFTPLASYLSRRDEREADRFASGLTGTPDAMASALVKLSKENLSNLHPHPLYAKFYYSHPPVVERVRKLKSLRDS